MGFDLNNIQGHKKAIKPTKTENVTFFLQKEITLFSNFFSNKVKEGFYTELSVLLKAGINLKAALELIANSQKKTKNKELIQKIIDNIVSGKSLSEAAKEEKTFTNYEFHSLKIGEETGTLHKVTEQLGHFFYKKNEQRRNLINALTYPIIILSTAILVMLFMLNFVVPMFQDIFKQQNIELPAITKFIIGLSDFVKSYGLLLFLGMIILFASGFFLKKQLWYNKGRDNLILEIPVIGNFVKMIYVSQFIQAIALLTASKVPLVESIKLVKQMINFNPLKQALEEVNINILKGDSLSSSLKKNTLFDAKMIALIEVAEETNQNEFIFDRLNKQYSTKVEQYSKQFSIIMEPLIILLVGILVGVILIAMYLPMFKLSSIVG